ncbi:DUF2892 domain-containing protein [Salinarchaeum sp. IM2453]|uniref:DUF2892 domain-containing protein n=1 Tax=Salinarchaeum sp. IM2453 TaxID=2862870 RepID=UPI0037CA3E31
MIVVKKNIGETDRAVRIWSGAVCGPIAAGTVKGYLDIPEIVAPVLGFFAIYMFITGLTRISPLYVLLGISSIVGE